MEYGKDRTLGHCLTAVPLLVEFYVLVEPLSQCNLVSYFHFWVN